MTFTPSQLAAIDYRGSSLLVSSAAGSGKTMILVERLLKYIEEKHNIDRFLVITYTRAAAYELKERIYERLQARLAQSPGDMHLRRQAMLSAGANIDTIHTFCALILRENAHLAGLSPDFRIADENECEIIKNDVLSDVFDRTYDESDDLSSMVKLLLMTTDGRDDVKLTELVSDMYTKIRSTPDPEGWLCNEIEKFKNIDKVDITQEKWCIEFMQSLRKRVEHCHELMLDIQGNLDADPKLKEAYHGSISETIEFIGTLLDAMKDSYDEAVKHVKIPFNRVKPISGYDELKNKRLWCKAELEKIGKNLINSSADHNNDAAVIAPVIIKLLELVLLFHNSYSAEKQKRGVVDFSDLEHMTLSLLYDPKTGKRTQIASSIASRFDEILIDEYQDVNEVQEKLFAALSNDGKNVFMVGDVKQSIYRFRLAEPLIFLRKYKKYRDITPKSCDAQTLAAQGIAENEPSRGNSADDKEHALINLSENFRSRAEVLETVNFIFRKIMSEDLGELEYTDAQSLIPGRNDGQGKQGKQGKQGVKSDLTKEFAFNNDNINDDSGAAPVEIILLSSNDVSESEEDVPADIELEAEFVAEKIKSMIESSYLIKDKTGQMRKLKYSDVAILSRSIKGITWRFAKALNDRNIPSDLSNTDSYFESTEIRAALSLLSVVDNPLQDIPLAAVLRGPVYSFTSDELTQVRQLGVNLSYFDALKRAAEYQNETRSEDGEIMSTATACKCKTVLADLNSLRDEVNDLPADKFIWNMYNKTGLLSKTAAMTDGERRKANLISLAQFAAGYEKAGYKGLFGFLLYIRNLQERGIDIVDAKGATSGITIDNDAVKIMSIHKSKGLEFPVVFLVNTAKRHNTTDFNKPFVFHKEIGIGGTITDSAKRIKYTTLTRLAVIDKLKREMLSEELRILYVAMTRAREKLIITAIYGDAQKQIDKIKLLEANDGRYSPEALMSMTSLAQWIIAGTFNAGNADKLPATVSVIELGDKQSKDENTDDVNSFDDELDDYCDTDTCCVTEHATELVTDRETVQASGQITGNITEMRQAEANEELIRRLEDKKFDFIYPYEQATVIPSKLTVTALKDISDSDAMSAAWVETEEESDLHIQDAFKAIRKPRFISQGAKLTPSERGTLVHEIMRYIDFEKCSNDDDMRNELQRIVNAGLQDSEAIASIDEEAGMFLRFINSDLGRRMCTSKALTREFKFSLLTEAEKYYPGGGEDKILIQGVIDCFFEEDGQLVVVDYKTDKVTEATVHERALKYTPQLEGYSEAITRITGKEVKERILYFFTIDKAINV